MILMKFKGGNSIETSVVIDHRYEVSDKPDDCETPSAFRKVGGQNTDRRTRGQSQRGQLGAPSFKVILLTYWEQENLKTYIFLLCLFNPAADFNVG